MTEPTHHYRADVEAYLDHLMDVTRDQDSRLLEEAARATLRGALASAWQLGLSEGLDRGDEPVVILVNPYGETDIS